jgi:hypothetical protein
MDITELLERAVEDVVPAERRPTDAVLRLADSRRLGSRIRKALAGLVGVAVIGGGAVVVATGNDDRDRETEPPRPLTLEVDLPTGWSEVSRPTVVDCTTRLNPRTIYRDATIGDLGSCGDRGPAVTGPTLLVGRLDPQVAEMVRTAGVAVPAAGTAGYVVGFDAASTFGVFLPVGSDRDVAYAVLAPHDPADEPAYGEPYNVVPVPTLPAELLERPGGGGRPPRAGAARGRLRHRAADRGPQRRGRPWRAGQRAGRCRRRAGRAQGGAGGDRPVR